MLLYPGNNSIIRFLCLATIYEYIGIFQIRTITRVRFINNYTHGHTKTENHFYGQRYNI